MQQSVLSSSSFSLVFIRDASFQKMFWIQEILLYMPFFPGNFVPYKWTRSCIGEQELLWLASLLYAYLRRNSHSFRNHTRTCSGYWQDHPERKHSSQASAPQSKNTVSTNIKHSRHIHLMSNSHQSTSILKDYMFGMVDIPFSYGRGLVVYSSLQGRFH